VLVQSEGVLAGHAYRDKRVVGDNGVFVASQTCCCLCCTSDVVTQESGMSRDVTVLAG
jgi:hypothetical protein